MDFLKTLDQRLKEGKIPSKLAKILGEFYLSYAKAIAQNEINAAAIDPLFNQFLDRVVEQLQSPWNFEPYHQRITAPFNYYKFGLEFLKPLVLLDSSKVLGINFIDKMIYQIFQGDNVILFANHQTEPDPQAISILLEKSYPKFAEEMIFVAGDRVISDPLAVPFSKGRNLLCIFSKKHIETPPELKLKKLTHNQLTMKKMAQLLNEGSKCIYVAPSGGRDRPDASGKVEVAPFDSSSIEMFWLISKQTQRPTHFYPLALATYNLLPPPNSVENEIGEMRRTQRTSIHLAFGDEIDMELFSAKQLDKKQLRKLRADYIWNLVQKLYQQIS
jgi:glycerol-3-phosphate O-acyltransferase